MSSCFSKRIKLSKVWLWRISKIILFPWLLFFNQIGIHGTQYNHAIITKTSRSSLKWEGLYHLHGWRGPQSRRLPYAPFWRWRKQRVNQMKIRKWNSGFIQRFLKFYLNLGFQCPFGGIPLLHPKKNKRVC